MREVESRRWLPLTDVDRQYLSGGGAVRAFVLQQRKAAENAKTYGGLPEGAPSRKVQRRAVRKAVKHQIAVAKAEAIANRRKKKATNV